MKTLCSVAVCKRHKLKFVIGVGSVVAIATNSSSIPNDGENAETGHNINESCLEDVEECGFCPVCTVTVFESQI